VKIVVATRNRHKLDELRDLCANLPLELVGLEEVAPDLDVEETGETFAENAALKARAAAAVTGLCALADDSGLEVDALGGAPGVRSARFAGEPSDDARNNALLLERLAGVPADRRAARYHAVVAIARPGQTDVRFAHGVCEGSIAFEPRGTGGFGYDPLFILPTGQRMAELTRDEKNRISHRARAAATLHAELALLTDD
jgi:XTP/dITP diphosphohydrolase